MYSTDVPGAFFSDSTAPTGSRFRCSSCGCEQCSRVTVRKPGGGSYMTEFVSCAMCRVLYHWPGEVPRAPHSSDMGSVQQLFIGSGRLIADLVTGRKPDIDPDGFGIERYGPAARPQWQPRLAMTAA